MSCHVVQFQLATVQLLSSCMQRLRRRSLPTWCRHFPACVLISTACVCCWTTLALCQHRCYTCLQVCVDPAYQRNGIGKWMLEVHGQHWLPNLLPDVKSRSLICKQEQIGFFQSVGFELVGPSEIKRGARQWYEMRQVLQRR